MNLLRVAAIVLFILAAVFAYIATRSTDVAAWVYPVLIAAGLACWAAEPWARTRA